MSSASVSSSTTKLLILCVAAVGAGLALRYAGGGGDHGSDNRGDNRGDSDNHTKSSSRSAPKIDEEPKEETTPTPEPQPQETKTRHVEPVDVTKEVIGAQQPKAELPTLSVEVLPETMDTTCTMVASNVTGSTNDAVDYTVIIKDAKFQTKPSFAGTNDAIASSEVSSIVSTDSKPTAMVVAQELPPKEIIQVTIQQDVSMTQHTDSTDKVVSSNPASVNGGDEPSASALVSDKAVESEQIIPTVTPTTTSSSSKNRRHRKKKKHNGSAKNSTTPAAASENGAAVSPVDMKAILKSKTKSNKPSHKARGAAAVAQREIKKYQSSQKKKSKSVQ
uniref:Uncharacterized protein n=1 Tax=Craspedostauros australis TaxID=1486917 RepID=A0A7R9WZ62_9STRA|mmetsp:Transcript_24524/g.68357  ORF Transcript_24524/g.68357 Transcript_24524/m.68357 type:complete len:333 (+) Transcript_24524:202-1200(+)|eukprot:CAMPEP_0198117880 /NCGR_PEP_ID=MMETSP1442-20131203/19580_1 /TAXON_ID= /ORGANISM="Craspedostauros australis, Strain CCMP3328" /LENGTH=332 /DNA_ID=CAMNT_0043776027 /DNA_START=154 /DNA_END=1152 /DNA_ORIENTATION=+